MVRWYHLIITAYGFWLPNDPRGSWSDFIGSWELYKFGPATTVSDKRSYAHHPHDVAARRAAKASLKYPPVRFDARQRDVIVEGFGEAVLSAGYRVYAGCVGHDHAHLVLGRHERTVEQIARHLKSKATMHLTRAGIHPLRDYSVPGGATPTPWAQGCWSVFVNDEDQLRAAIAYVERHPGEGRVGATAVGVPGEGALVEGAPHGEQARRLHDGTREHTRRDGRCLRSTKLASSCAARMMFGP